jgi:predicted ATP-dependent serine protease
MLTLADHLTRSGTVAVFNTAEESLFQVKAVCERLGLKKGFAVGNETNVSDLLKKADKLRLMPVNKDKPFLLIIDSLQCMDDGHFSTGRITCQTAERSLEQVTSWCKENYTNAIVIGQVTKSGNFAGSNKLRHMVDCHTHLGIEKKGLFVGFRTEQPKSFVASGFTAADEEIISELQALFARHNAGNAPNAKAVFKPTRKFHTARHRNIPPRM